MTRLYCGFLLVALFLGGAGSPQGRRLQPPFPSEFLIGRHTFIDVGAPNDFYELFSIRAADKGTSIERVVVTPPGVACLEPATVKIASVSIKESVTDLPGKTNPCTIPERELRGELKRCNKCLVFSGADVVMQVQCGDQSRRIRTDILDRDMFDPNPRTPEHTSWSMTLLGRLDAAFGDTVMEQPILTALGQPESRAAESKPTPLSEEVRQGRLDALFEKAPDRLSDVFRQSQLPPPAPPSVELLNSSPFRPIVFDLPKYPALANSARVDGEVTLTFDITADGGTSNLKILAGAPLLRGTVEAAVAGWKFPKEAAGQQVRATLAFKINCR
jgi:TonB family protein